MKHGLLLLVASLFSAATYACGCAGITSIDYAFHESEEVLFGRVERRVPYSSVNGVEQPEYYVVKTVKSLKGEVGPTVKVTQSPQCYRSIDLTELKIGGLYVIPLGYRNGDRFDLRACSESALEWTDGSLFGFHLNESSKQRERMKYMRYDRLELLFASGWFSLPPIETMIRLASAIGGVSLVLWWRLRVQRSNKENAI